MATNLANGQLAATPATLLGVAPPAARRLDFFARGHKCYNMTMQTKVRKIGNSLGIVLPKESLEQLQVKETIPEGGETREIDLNGGKRSLRTIEFDEDVALADLLALGEPDEALQQLGQQVQPRQLEVSTGAFGVQPRYSDKGRVIGWQGQADLVIEGRDFARVAQAVAQVPRMPVESAQFSLSREGRQKLEAEVQSQAVQNFRQRAQALARDFGFAGYTLRQVNVSSAERPEPVVQARMMVTADAAPAPSPIPLVAGKDEVRITVSGSIQLR